VALEYVYGARFPDPPQRVVMLFVGNLGDTVLKLPSASHRPSTGAMFVPPPSSSPLIRVPKLVLP